MKRLIKSMLIAAALFVGMFLVVGAFVVAGMALESLIGQRACILGVLAFALVVAALFGWTITEPRSPSAP